MLITNELTEFLRNTQPLFDGVLGDIQYNALNENMPVIPPETARLLSVLLSLKKPVNVLEIGCAVGFSTGLICGYLQNSGHITTIDRYDIMIEQARINFARLGIEDKVTLLEGNACDILPTLKDSYDFIFLDAAKGQYGNLFPDCLRLLSQGGLFVADDVLQGGGIAGDRLSVPRRQRTTHTRMRGFLKAVAETPGLLSSVVTIGDGLLIAYKT